MMNSSVQTIIVDAKLASLTMTSITRTASTSPTSRTNRSDNGSSGTISSLGSIAPNAHFMAALRLAADRKVLRAPGSLRQRPPMLAPKPWTSSLQASRIASRITTRRCLSREPRSDRPARAETAHLTCRHVCRHSNSPKTSSQQMVTRNTAAAAAVRVSRSKLRYMDVDNLDSEFTQNKDRHSSAAGGGKSTRVYDWPLLQAAAQEMLTEVTQQSAAEPRLSDADLREAIQLLLEKRAREQQQQQQQGKQQRQRQPPMASGGGVLPRWMAAQREIEMACGFGDCVKDDGSGGGGKKSGYLRLIVCVPKPGGVTTQSWEEPADKPGQPQPLKLEAGAKLKVELSHFEPSMVLEAAEENSDSPVHAKLNVFKDDDGLSLPGVELWRDSSSCVHNADILEAKTAALTESLAVATQAEPKPPQPKARKSDLVIGMSQRESVRSSFDHERMRPVQREFMKEGRQQETSSVEEKMRVPQQELLEEWKEQMVRDTKDDVASADCSDEGGFIEGSEDVASSDKNSDEVDEIEGSTELKTSSVSSVISKDSTWSKPKPNEIAREDILGQGIGPDGRASLAGSSGLAGLGNVKALMERRRELLQRLSKIQMPIVSCPAAVIGHLEDHPERAMLAKELVMSLQPAEDQQLVVQTDQFAWQNLNLKRPLRLNQYRRCSEDDELDNRSEDSFML